MLYAASTFRYTADFIYYVFQDAVFIQGLLHTNEFRFKPYNVQHTRYQPLPVVISVGVTSLRCLKRNPK